MTSGHESASAPSAPGSGAILDVLRAGLQVGGLGVAWVAVSERIFAGAERTRSEELVPLLAVILAAAAFATRSGFPERPKGLPGFLRRFAVVAPCGAAMAFGAAVGFANAWNPGQSSARAAGCLVTGLAIAALGFWPRRAVTGARPSAFADALIGGAPLVLPALAGAGYVEAWRGWALPSFAAANPIAGSPGLTLSLVLGLATLISLAAGVWLARGERRGRWVVLVAPAVALLGTFGWMRSLLTAEDGRAIDAGATYASIVDGRAAALANATLGACAGGLSAALLLAVGAIALGVRAFRRAPVIAAQRRAIAVFAALATTPAVYAVLLFVSIDGLGTSDRLVTFVAAVPAALAAIGVWLAAGGTDDPEGGRAPDAGADLLVAAGCSLGALALAALGQALVVDLPAPNGMFEWHELGPRLPLFHRQTLLATAVHAAPVLVLALVALPPRRLRAGLARASVALAGVALLAGLSSSLLLSQVSSAAAEIHAPWKRSLPPDLSPPEVASTDRGCDLVLDDVLFVGTEHLARAGGDLGASAQLDSVQGCAAVATALGRARDGRKDAPRIAADARVPWARLECLARALTSQDAAAPLLRRFDWIAADRESGAPVCVQVRVGGLDRPRGDGAERPLPRSWSRLVVLTSGHTLEGEVDADPQAPAMTLREIARGDWPRETSRPTAFAAAPDVPAGSFLALFARGGSGSVQLLLAEVGPGPQDPGEGSTPAELAIRLRTRSPGAAPILEGLQARLLACHARAAAPAAGGTSSGAVFALIGGSGKLLRLFSAEGSDGAPEATRCMRDVLAGASWPAEEALVAIRYDLSPAAPAAPAATAAPPPP